MKSVTRLLLTGVGAVAAVVLAAAPASAAIEVSAVPASVSAQACTWEVTDTTVRGSCSVSTPLGSFSGSFDGTFHSDDTASGTVVFDGGALGSFDGTWHGGPFVSGQTATIYYTANTPIGPISGEVEVEVP